MDERQFFDMLAPSWDQNEVLSTPDKISYILDVLKINKGEEILDLGTGTGVLIPFLVERIGKTGKIVAVDYSKEMLKRAIEKYSDITPSPVFLNIDFETETIRGEFDRILLYCVYPHLHTPIDTLKWLEKVNLKEGGTITIAFPCDNSFINNIHREKHSESDILPTPEVLAQTLREEGFEVDVLEDSKEAYIINIKKK